MRNPSREQQILDLLHDRDVVQVGELAERSGVSEATIRRDLTSMEERGLLRRIHGGATLAGLSRHEPLFRDKEDLNTEAKRAIAQTALTLIDDGDTIFLDGGSTLLHLARLLDRRRNLVVVTNSMMAAANLMESSHRLILIGGEFRQLSRTLVGPLTAPVIRSLHVDKAFMGTIGFTLREGMTTTDPNEAHTKELIMERAGQVILLADSSKHGACSFAHSGKLTDLDIVIAESMAEDFRLGLERQGIEFLPAARDMSLVN